MAELVAQVADDRAVRLLQALPVHLAVVVVGLGHVDRDEAARVAGHHRRRVGQRLEQVEGEPARVVVFLGHDRQPAGDEAEQHAPLRRLDVGEPLGVLRPRQVGNRAREPARQARGVRLVSRDEPVARGGARAVLAEAKARGRGARVAGHRPRAVACRRRAHSAAARTDRTRPRHRRRGTGCCRRTAAGRRRSGRLSSRDRTRARALVPWANATLAAEVPA